MNRKPTLAGYQILGCFLIGVASFLCMTGARARGTGDGQKENSFHEFHRMHPDFIRILRNHPTPWLHLETLSRSRTGVTRDALILGRFSGSPSANQKPLTVFITPALNRPGRATRIAALALFQHLANPQIRNHLLDHLTLVFFLVHRTGRPVADNPNPPVPGLRSPWDVHNVDLLTAQSRRARDWLRLFQHWKPDVVMELGHVQTATWRAQCLFGGAPHALLPHPLSRVAHRLLSEARAIWQQRHVKVRSWFRLRNSASPSLGIITVPGHLSDPVPYSALNGALAFQWIWKGHSYGNRSSTRLWKTLDSWFGLLIQDRLKILKARAQGHDIVHSDPVSVHLPLPRQLVQEPTPFMLHTYAYDETLSPISGTVWVRYNRHKPRNYLVPRFGRRFVTLQQPDIAGYLVPAAFTRTLHLLARQGIQMKTFRKPRTLRVIADHLDGIRWNIPPETRVPTIRSYRATARTRVLTYPTGSVFIPLNQRRAALVVALLDPHSPDNLLYLGFFRSMFDRLPRTHQNRLESIARQLLRTHPQLVRGFLRRILDHRFADSPRSRLDFFYRHLYRDPVSRHLYPVAEWPQETDHAGLSLPPS